MRAGEIVGLAGLVGAGRTELARILFGITPADTGEIAAARPAASRFARRATRSPTASPTCRKTAAATASFSRCRSPHNMTMAIHPSLFPGRWLRFGAESANSRSKFIRDLGVKASGPDAPGGSLSGGNQQKVALARWLATKPKLLILDEPTQGVDVGAKAEIHRIIRAPREGRPGRADDLQRSARRSSA